MCPGKESSLQKPRNSSFKNQTKALIIRLAELQQKFKSQLQRVLVVKVGALFGKEQDPIMCDRDVWEDLSGAENFKP